MKEAKAQSYPVDEWTDWVSLYLITSGETNHFKIGSSICAKGRKGQLQSELSVHLQLQFSRELPTRTARNLEAEIINTLRSCPDLTPSPAPGGKRHREWFRGDSEIAMAVIKAALIAVVPYWHEHAV